MNKISKKELERMVKDINVNEYSHIIICANRNDGTCFLRFINNQENISEVIKNLENTGIYGLLSIDEIYDCNLDTDKDKQVITNTPKKQDDINYQRALVYATKMHQGQCRNDGTEYINHPIRVSNYIKEFKQSSNLEMLRICGLLHDTIEDTEATYYDIVKLFGPQIASIVLELTTDEDLKKEIGKTKYLEIKMKNMSSWALVVKLCDRLDNVSDLMNSEESFRNKYIKETIEIMNYLLENRKLSKTHIKIIKCIIKRLILVTEITNLSSIHNNLLETNIKVRRLTSKKM